MAQNDMEVIMYKILRYSFLVPRNHPLKSTEPFYRFVWPEEKLNRQPVGEVTDRGRRKNRDNPACDDSRKLHKTRSAKYAAHQCRHQGKNAYPEAQFVQCFHCLFVHIAPFC